MCEQQSVIIQSEQDIKSIGDPLQSTFIVKIALNGLLDQRAIIYPDETAPLDGSRRTASLLRIRHWCQKGCLATYQRFERRTKAVG